MKILFLTAWYPHRNDDMEGLFVRKHAQAAAQYNDVHVLFLKSDPALQNYHYEYQTRENVGEHHLYYPAGKNHFSKLFLFLKMYHIGWRKVLEKLGKPDLIHENILTRHGFIALFIRWRYGIPYVITEHWSRYYRNEFHGWLHRRLTRLVAGRSQRIMPVSENLAQAMQSCGIHGNYTVVRNVVDDFFFRPGLPAAMPNTAEPLKTIVHICCFDEPAKNNFGLLRAAKTLSLVRSDFRLLFIGDGKDRQKTMDYAELLHFPQGRIVFTGKLQPTEVKKEIDRSRFMVLFSNYETASVVISESLACGKPVIATKTGGIPEIVDSRNGILIDPQDEKSLWEALNRMLDNYTAYAPESIRKTAEIFSFQHIGVQLDAIYRAARKQ